MHISRATARGARRRRPARARSRPGAPAASTPGTVIPAASRSATWSIVSTAPSSSSTPRTSSLPSGWTYTGTLKVSGSPVLPDPAYNTPYQATLYAGTSTTANPPSAVELKPGVYPSDPHFSNSSSCHFMDAGIYTFPSGYTDNGGFNSNELKSPIEPYWNGSSIDYTQPANT